MFLGWKYQDRNGNKSKFLFLSFLLFLVIFFIFFSNINSGLKFSKEPGFYDEPFYLEIHGANNCKIYYTLDGTEPSEDSIPYDGAFYLEDATRHANIYSARTDTSTAFLTELVEKYSSGNPGYTIPDYNVDKCNTVRAAAFDKNGNCTETISGSYFIGLTGGAAYKDMAVVSLITDPENLFDYNNGIYVTGNVFDKFRELLPNENTPLRNCWWWWESNYSKKGREYERTAHIEIFNPDKRLMLSENCGFRIQGRGSRGKLPKSLNIYARVEYSGSRTFDEDIFEIGSKPHKFVIFSGGDDTAYKIKDYLAHSIESGLNFSTMEFQPALLFLDGEYWGTYYITESYNAEYISGHYGVAEEDVIIVKEYEVAEGEEEDLALYQAMQTYIAENDMTVETNYQTAQSLIDLSSYIDYYAAQIFIGRHGDWPLQNEGAWRTRSIVSGSRYADGRWRWLLFDVNSGGLALDLLETDTLADVITADRVFASLFENTGFKKQFAERLLYIADEIYSDEKIDRFINDYMENMKEPICMSNQRFHNWELRDSIGENAENIRSFLKQRSDYIYEIIRNDIGYEYLE